MAWWHFCQMACHLSANQEMWVEVFYFKILWRQSVLFSWKSRKSKQSFTVCKKKCVFYKRYLFCFDWCFINQSVDQNPRRPGVIGVPRQMLPLCCDGHPSTPVLCNAEPWWHRLARPLLDVDHLSFHNLWGLPLWHLPSTEPCTMIFGSVSRRQTWPYHDNLRGWQQKLLRSGYDTDLLPNAFVCFMLSVWHDKHPAVAFCFQRPGFAFPDQPSTSSSHIHTEAPTRQVVTRRV